MSRKSTKFFLTEKLPGKDKFGKDKCSSRVIDVKARALSVLLRDAQLTWRDIEDQPNARKRKDRIRARDLAINELIKIGRTGMHQGEKLGALDRCRILNLYKDLGMRNRKTRTRDLPKRKGGRPRESPARLRLAVAIWEAVGANSKKPKNEQEAISSVLEKVAHRLHKKPSYVTEVYYDRHREWKLAVKAAMWFNKENAEIKTRRAETKQRRDETEIAPLATLLASEYAQQRETASEALGMSPAALDIAVKQAQKRNSKYFKALRVAIFP